jgi:hypothetical protein
MSSPTPEPRPASPSLTPNRLLLIKIQYTFYVFLAGIVPMALLMIVTLFFADPPKQMHVLGLQGFTAIASLAAGNLCGLLNSRTSAPD